MIENKSTVYNGPTLYNGDGSVYNGNGVYNDGSGRENFVEIQGIKYSYVVINGIKVITRNLTFRDDNIVHRTTSYAGSVPSSWLYNFKSSEDPNDYGMYFNNAAVIYMSQSQDIFPAGWRVWTKSDIDKILSAGFTPRQLISANYGGTNESGLNLYFSGLLGSFNTTFEDVGIAFNSWRNSNSDSDRGGLYVTTQPDDAFQFDGWTYFVGRSIRLTCDA